MPEEVRLEKKLGNCYNGYYVVESNNCLLPEETSYIEDKVNFVKCDYIGLNIFKKIKIYKYRSDC